MKNILAKIKSKLSNTVIINGVSYSGTNIQICGQGNVQINGKHVIQCDDKIINITIQGDCEAVETVSGDIIIHGNVAETVESVSGDIKVEGVVSGNVETTSGDVACKSIKGSVKTVSGDIN